MRYRYLSVNRVYASMYKKLIYIYCADFQTDLYSLLNNSLRINQFYRIDNEGHDYTFMEIF